MSLFLIRHAQSEANADTSILEKKADAYFDLTPLGREQALECAKKLVTNLDKDVPLKVFISPFNRTVQTFEIVFDYIKKSTDFQVLSYEIDFRLVEQSQGNFVSKERAEQFFFERDKYSKFYYRYPEGESSYDVYLKQLSFIKDTSLEVLCLRYNTVIFGHGRQMRALRMAIENQSSEWFDKENNYPNGTIIKYNKYGEEPLFL